MIIDNTATTESYPKKSKPKSGIIFFGEISTDGLPPRKRLTKALVVFPNIGSKRGSCTKYVERMLVSQVSGWQSNAHLQG
jgi:hypothetical protein